MPINERLITLIVDRFKCSLSLLLFDRDTQDFAESEFITSSTKSSKSFFKFIYTERAAVFTPSAWIDIQMF